MGRRELGASCAAPPLAKRGNHTVAYDSARSRLVLFGGSNEIGFNFGDTWLFDGANWNPVASFTPDQRYSHGMAYDINRGRMVVFGGAVGIGNYGSDTWENSGIAWTKVCTGGGCTPPSKRAEFGMTYDSTRGKTVLFGG